uniref:hypothetical protein n=1 Tax=Roseovarius indicus TaxID=540747 RepID=UPI003B52994E
MTRFMQVWILAQALAMTAATAMAETVVGKNVDSRVILAFNVKEEGASAMLPEGWRAVTLPKGPMAGANMLVAFIDRHLALDPEGKPLVPHASRSLAQVAFGVSPEVEGSRMFVTRVYETLPVADSYGNGAAAAISRETALSGPAEGSRVQWEAWVVAPEAGGEIRLEMSYAAGRPSWGHDEARPYSAAKPDFHRIYRYDQLADLAMSTALGKALDGEISFSASVPGLDSVFDGRDVLTAVLVVPVYVREVSLP